MPSAVVKGKSCVSIKENFFSHTLLKYMVLTTVTRLSGDAAPSKGRPCTSPSAWERDGEGNTGRPVCEEIKQARTAQQPKWQESSYN